jgi:hypothetical protein
MIGGRAGPARTAASRPIAPALRRVRVQDVGPPGADQPREPQDGHGIAKRRDLSMEAG